MNNSYESFVIAFCHDNLISLYLHVADSSRFVTTKSRNAYLLKRFKSQVKLPQYKVIKKEIKTLIVKAEKLDLERQLLKLNESIKENSQLAEVENCWHDLLYRLHEVTQYKIDVYSNSSKGELDTVYVIKDEIFDSFQAKGKVDELTMLVDSSNSEQQSKFLSKLHEIDSEFKYQTNSTTEKDGRMLIKLAYLG